jgi:hypothetical protein
LIGAALALAGLAAVLTTGAPLQAQTGSGWTAPELIYEGRGSADQPVIIADAYGQVHGFWTAGDETLSAAGQALLYYARLDNEQRRSVDIFVIPATAQGVTARAWQNGLGVLWGGGNFAWSAHSPELTAQAWSAPTRLQQGYPHAGLATAPDGSLAMAFGATTGEVYVQWWEPERSQWGAPILVGDTANAGAAADYVSMAVGSDGTWHVTWSEYQLPNGWPPLGLYYAQSSNGGETWSARRRLASGNFNMPAVYAGPDNAVYLTWTGVAGTGGKYFQESVDGGQTWAEPVAVQPAGTGGGSEGQPNLLIDGGGGLHLFYSNADGCAWHVRRTAGVWGAPECISQDVPATVLEYPAATISLGNELHVLFFADRRQIWHTQLTLDLPAETALPIPTLPTPTPIPPTATLAPTPTATPLPDFGPSPTGEMVTQPGVLAVVAGVAPVGVLMVLVLAARRRGARRRGGRR